MTITQQYVLSKFEYRDGELYRKTNNKKAGSTLPSGYKNIYINGKTYLIHRVIYLMKNGCIPKEIDHINNNRSDNRIENLRPATRNQNRHNSLMRSNNSSGYKGVHWCSRDKKWIAKIRKNYKRYCIGYYDNPEEAHNAYKQAATKLHKEFANFG